MPDRLKVLASVYACEPDKGSEPGVGWNWVEQIAQAHEVWAITRANNREAIERALSQHRTMRNVHWIYCDLPRWLTFWKKGGRGLYLYYYLWQIQAFFLARKLHRQIGLDVAHHITFVTYWLPSFISWLDIPFIWGPVGGGETAPKSFFSTFSRRGRLYECKRKLIGWQARLNPFVRQTAQRAQKTLVTTCESEQAVRQLGTKQVFVFPAVALSTQEYDRLCQIPFRDTAPFRVLSAGSLLHWKGYHLGMAAFALFSRSFPGSEYWIAGNGPERERLEEQAHALEIAQQVRFWGKVSREQLWNDLMPQCDTLLHPSLHDSGGWITLEAMAAGRPVICLDLGGPALQVTSDTGFKVPALNPTQSIEALAEALHQLAGNPQQRRKMGQAARLHIQEQFIWERKATYLSSIYA